MFMVISTSEYFLTMILIEPPLLVIFILLVKMLSGVYLVIGRAGASPPSVTTWTRCLYNI